MGTPLPECSNVAWKGFQMLIGPSLFLLAAGAILAFAVEVEGQGFDVNAIGVILMAVGGLGFLASLMFWSGWVGVDRRETVVEERRPRRRIIEEEV